MAASAPEVVLGLLLLFGLPGWGVTKAVFPEWRLRGPEALLRTVEVGTLSLVLSVALTVLVGFGLGALPGNLFQTGWSDPLLEIILAAIAGIALAIAALRGGFRREAPHGPAPEPSPGEEAPFALVEKLESNRREFRRVRHALRQLSPGDPVRSELEKRVAILDDEFRRVRERREAEYGS
ncbi:MAG: DUF1616 domain-containing protein [Thermoplasmata archaeon]|nr:DUF1616 domain-containing protein [Thermoplasmata archaeon]